MLNTAPRRVSALLVAIACLGATQVAATQSAHAEECARDNPSVKVYDDYFKASKERVGGGSGVTLHLEAGHDFTVSANLHATAGVDASKIKKLVKAEIDVTVSGSYTGHVKRGADWTVPKSWKRGWFAAGVDKHKVRVRNDIRLPNCKLVRTDFGTTYVVEPGTVYDHWRTK